MNKNSIVYLVYFNCRGTGHYYRYVIYEIGVPFQQIHVNNNGTLPESLQQCNISMADIPCIIHEGKIIKQLYTAMRYLCKRFDRLDLLGNNLSQQAQISEIFSKNAKKKSYSISLFLNCVQRIIKQPQNIKKIKEEMVNQFASNPGALEACSILYSQTGNFLFDHLTIVDFLYYENCYYFLGFFGDVGRRRFFIHSAFKNFFERTQFYKNHVDKIQSFQHIVPIFDERLSKGFSLMWQYKK